MRQIKVISFTPSVRDEAFHAVFYFPESGSPRKLRVIGSVLAQVNEFVGAEPFTATRFVLEPVFAFKDRIVLGTDYMDSTSVIAISTGWAEEARAADERKRRTKG